MGSKNTRRKIGLIHSCYRPSYPRRNPEIVATDVADRANRFKRIRYIFVIKVIVMLSAKLESPYSKSESSVVVLSQGRRSRDPTIQPSLLRTVCRWLGMITYTDHSHHHQHCALPSRYQQIPDPVTPPRPPQPHNWARSMRHNENRHWARSDLRKLSYAHQPHSYWRWGETDRLFYFYFVGHRSRRYT